MVEQSYWYLPYAERSRVRKLRSFVLNDIRVIADELLYTGYMEYQEKLHRPVWRGATLQSKCSCRIVYRRVDHDKVAHDPVTLVAWQRTQILRNNGKEWTTSTSFDRHFEDALRLLSAMGWSITSYVHAVRWPSDEAQIGIWQVLTTTK